MTLKVFDLKIDMTSGCQNKKSMKKIFWPLWSALVASSSRARAQLRRNKNKNIFLFKLGLIQNKSIKRYIKLQVNWDTELISEVKTNFGAFWPAR